jgi:TolA-binding protein
LKQNARFAALVAVLFLGIGAWGQQTAASAAEGPEIQGLRLLTQGQDSYQQAKYQDAINSFRELLVNPNFAPYRGDAYFWVAKSLFALNRLDDAARNFEFFITNFKDNGNQPEAAYQRGRILYLQSEYQSAIQAFSKFLEAWPSSSYVPNAYYWTGEALYSMGQLDQAQKMFQIVIQEYPTSYRVEAARYRVALIDLRKREIQLLELLKWSHQENIRNLEEFQKRERVYDEAIQSYQKRITNLSTEDIKEEIRILQQKADTALTQVDADLTRINELNTQLRDAQAQLKVVEQERDAALSQAKDLQARMAKPLADALAELAQRQRLLDTKEQALKLKEQALQSKGEGK